MTNAFVNVGRPGRVNIVTWSRRDPLNPLADDLIDELGRTTREIDASSDVHATVLCGAGRTLAIAAHSLPVATGIKESVNRAFESSLHEGFLIGRRAFHAGFAPSDRKEGIRAFLDRRAPSFEQRSSAKRKPSPT